MIDAIDVCNFIADEDNYDKNEKPKLLSACGKAVLWLERNIKPDADPNGKKALHAAAAVARFNIFCDSLSSVKSFKAGDITVNRDIGEEYKAQTVCLENALAQLSDILVDGGFYFEAT